MSSSKERVGGVEPETVTAEAGFAAQSKAYCDMADQMCRERNEAQRELSVQRATLRSVEEELRQARAAHEDAMLAEGHIIETLEADVDRLSRLFDASWADRDRLTRELRQAREERDAIFKVLRESKYGCEYDWEESPVQAVEYIAYQRDAWCEAAEEAEADRDRLAAEAVVLKSMLLRRDVAQAHIDDCVASAVLSASAALSPVGQGDPGQETIDGDPQPLGSAITICTGCGYIVRAGDEGFHRECDDGVLIDYERADDPGQEQGAEGGGDSGEAAGVRDEGYVGTCKWGVTENVDGWRWWAVDGAWMCDGVAASRDEAVREVERWAMTARPVVAGGGEGDNRPWRPLLTEEDWQSFPTDPETRDTVLDYLAERGYLAVRDDDSEATR